MRQKILVATAIALIFFALLTLFLSSSVIFDLFQIREKEGNYVPFVVWANFVSSLLYLIAAYAMLKGKKGATMLLTLSAAILAAAFIGLKLHIAKGGVYELKTVNALMFRFSLTMAFAAASYFLIAKQHAIDTRP